MSCVILLLVATMSGVSFEIGEILYYMNVAYVVHQLSLYYFYYWLIEGRCVLGTKCLHPDHELRAEHTCPNCNNIVHSMCGTFDDITMKYLCGCNKGPRTITEIDVSVNEQMAQVSTITASTEEDTYKEIPRDYFITKNQKVNHKCRLDGGDDYIKLKKAIIQEINDNIKSMMIIQSQKIGLQVKDKITKELRSVQSYADIGYAWSCDDSPECAAKVNTVINATFTESKGFEYYLETKVMKKFKLRYAEDVSMKGSIARMIVIRKCELGKVINKRTEKTHQKKILKTRYKLEDGISKRLQSKKPCSFRIEKMWFNDDGSLYDDCKSSAIAIVPEIEKNTNYFMGKIKELQEELKIAKKVYLYGCILLHSFLYILY